MIHKEKDCGKKKTQIVVDRVSYRKVTNGVIRLIIRRKENMSTEVSLLFVVFTR